jgi:hypothetical protein
VNPISPGTTIPSVANPNSSFSNNDFANVGNGSGCLCAGIVRVLAALAGRL